MGIGWLCRIARHWWHSERTPFHREESAHHLHNVLGITLYYYSIPEFCSAGLWAWYHSMCTTRYTLRSYALRRHQCYRNEDQGFEIFLGASDYLLVLHHRELLPSYAVAIRKVPKSGCISSFTGCPPGLTSYWLRVSCLVVGYVIHPDPIFIH